MYKAWLIIAAVTGLLSVALGAFGAHALKSLLNEYGASIWETAVQYQMFHTIALLFVGIWQYVDKTANLDPAGWLFLIGMLLFSGSLYLLAVAQIKWLGAVTPFGGVAFLAGWGWMIYTFIKQ